MAEQRNQQRNQVSEVQGRNQGATAEAALMPLVDVIEDSSGITLLVDMPGVSKEKLNLQLETDSLTIEGELAMDSPEGMQSSHIDIRIPRYRRRFTLSRELDGEQVSAEFKNGVLKLRIPKAAHAQPRRIEINAG